MIEYFVSEIDEHGFTHSIDNVVVIYDIKPIFQSDYLQIFLDSLHNLRDSYKDEIRYWENLNCVACSRFSWFCNHVHLDDGIFLSLGHYREGIKEKRSYVIFPLLKLEINPNKHYNKPVFKSLQAIINRLCINATLKRYDYAIDVPKKISEVKVFNTRKEPGLYKGTYYFGQRNRDGYLRIYDKGVESELGYSLTRVEHTLLFNLRNRKTVAFTPFYVLADEKSSVLEEFSSNDKVIFDLCRRLQLCEQDFEDILSNLNFRKRKKIVEALCGAYKEVSFNSVIHDSLLKKIMEAFNVVTVDVEEENLYDDDFVELDENDSLPWEESKKIII